MRLDSDKVEARSTHCLLKRREVSVAIGEDGVVRGGEVLARMSRGENGSRDDMRKHYGPVCQLRKLAGGKSRHALAKCS